MGIYKWLACGLLLACHRREEAPTPVPAASNVAPPAVSTPVTWAMTSASGSGIEWGNEIPQSAFASPMVCFGGTSAPSGSIGLATVGDKPPRIRSNAGVALNGTLGNDALRKVVSANMARFRLCYDDGLKRDPKLAGIVATKLVIARDGSVAMTSRHDTTTLPDEAVVSCVVRGFGNLLFPAPDGGIVTTVMPIDFQPPHP